MNRPPTSSTNTRNSIGGECRLISSRRSATSTSPEAGASGSPASPAASFAPRTSICDSLVRNPSQGGAEASQARLPSGLSGDWIRPRRRQRVRGRESAFGGVTEPIAYFSERIEIRGHQHGQMCECRKPNEPVNLQDIVVIFVGKKARGRI